MLSTAWESAGRHNSASQGPRSPVVSPVAGPSDAAVVSPEHPAMMREASDATGIEMDDDGRSSSGGSSGGGDNLSDSDSGDENNGGARSVYAMSLYPGALHAARQNGHDGATITSTRTLYAEEYDFIVENGRQYCGDYFMPIDQEEQTRQFSIHQAYLRFFDRQLTTVPLDNPRYILDIGTGIGEWAIGMAERYPRAEVFGTDIAPIQPQQQVPFNVEFHIDDAEDEWIRPADTFDLVHMRNLEGAFSDWSFIYGQAFECIRPGGWIEVLDWEDWFAGRNFSSFFPEGSATRGLMRGVLRAAEAAGKPRGAGHLSPDLLRQAGFVEVREAVYDMGVGARDGADYGQFSLYSIVMGFEAQCLRLLTKHLGWDADEVRRQCREAALETKRVVDDPQRTEPFVVKLRVVTARKPLPGGEKDQIQIAGIPRSKVVEGVNGGDAGDFSGDESTIGPRTIRSDETA
ncbi:hypothetical protein VTJ83DRAFT_2555 [Remersonia thermophila]|uniref:S-adenosyl-L-methionine-dependent methyltransferase n=1 Tax=Remersonia thermophila TaxID=72144 RepID=A0ABR4DJD0_9PEZI